MSAERILDRINPWSKSKRTEPRPELVQELVEFGRQIDSGEFDVSAHAKTRDQMRAHFNQMLGYDRYPVGS